MIPRLASAHFRSEQLKVEFFDFVRDLIPCELCSRFDVSAHTRSFSLSTIRQQFDTCPSGVLEIFSINQEVVNTLIDTASGQAFREFLEGHSSTAQGREVRRGYVGRSSSQTLNFRPQTTACLKARRHERIVPWVTLSHMNLQIARYAF